MGDKPLTQDQRRSILSKVMGYLRRYELTSAQFAKYEAFLPRLEQQAYQKSQNYQDYIGRMSQIKETLKGIKLKPEFANQINMGTRHQIGNQSQVPGNQQHGSSNMATNQYNIQENPTVHQSMQQPRSMKQEDNMQDMINGNNQQPSMVYSQQYMLGNIQENNQQFQQGSLLINQQQQQSSYGRQAANISGQDFQNQHQVIKQENNLHQHQNMKQENNLHQQQIHRQEQRVPSDMMVKPAKQENVSEPHIIVQSIGRQPSFISNHMQENKISQQTNSQSYGRHSPHQSGEAFLNQQCMEQTMNLHQHHNQEHRVQNNMTQSGSGVPQRTMLQNQMSPQGLNGNLQHNQEQRMHSNMTQLSSAVPQNQEQQDLQRIQSQNQVSSQSILSWQGNNAMQQSQFPVPNQNMNNPQLPHVLMQSTAPQNIPNGFNQNATLKQTQFSPQQATNTCIQIPNVQPNGQTKGKGGRKRKVEATPAQRQQRGGGDNDLNTAPRQGFVQGNVALEPLQFQNRQFKTEEGSFNRACVPIEQKRECNQKVTTEVIQIDDYSSAQNINQANEAQKSFKEQETIKKLTSLIIPTPPLNKEELYQRVKPFLRMLQNIMAFPENRKKKHHNARPEILQAYKQKHEEGNMLLKQGMELVKKQQKVHVDELVSLQNMMLKYFEPFLSRLTSNKIPQPEDSNRLVNQENYNAGTIGGSQQVQASIETVEQKLERPSVIKNQEDMVFFHHDRNADDIQKAEDEERNGTKEVLQKSSSHDIGEEVAVTEEKEKQTMNTVEPVINNATDISEKEKEIMNTIEPPCIDNAPDIIPDSGVEEHNKKQLTAEQDIKEISISGFLTKNEEVSPLQRIINVIQKASPEALQRMARDWKTIMENTKNPWYGVPRGSPYEQVLIDRYESVCKRVKL